jgi:hypothetical protein
MSTVLVAPSHQLHAHQGFEIGHLKFDGAFGFVESRQSVLILRTQFFAGEQQMDSATRFALRPVDEQLNIEEVMVNEAGRFECGSDGGQIGTPHQDINIARGMDGVLVNPADPLGDRMAVSLRVTPTNVISYIYDKRTMAAWARGSANRDRKDSGWPD